MTVVSGGEFLKSSGWNHRGRTETAYFSFLERGVFEAIGMCRSSSINSYFNK